LLGIEVRVSSLIPFFLLALCTLNRFREYKTIHGPSLVVLIPELEKPESGQRKTP
jgi:hypothetical protein